MTLRPITNSDFINGLEPVEVMNWAHFMEHEGTSKMEAMVMELLGKSPRNVDAMNQLIELGNELIKDMKAAHIVIEWFRIESKNHIAMIHDTGDEIVITYDNHDNWTMIKED